MKSIFKLLARRTSRGVTLLEIVMATLITGVMLVASLNSVGAVFQTNQHNAETLKGPGLAHELMAEILSMPYKDPNGITITLGPDLGESSRNAFDDVDDYTGLNSQGIRAKSGAIRTGYSDWDQQVTVQWIDVDNGAVSLLGDTGLKRISVTITAPDGTVTQLRAFRYKEGVLETAPWLDTEAVTWIGAELQLGVGSTPARMGTNLPNHTSDAN